MYTQQDIIATIQEDIRIIIHLASKIDESMLNYQPTEKQRTLLELLQYLAYGINTMTQVVVQGDQEVAQKTMQGADQMTWDSFVQTIQRQEKTIIESIQSLDETQWHENMQIWGMDAPRHQLLMDMIIKGLAAYRMQLFLYLKAAGKTELNTMNLWAGVDAKL